MEVRDLFEITVDDILPFGFPYLEAKRLHSHLVRILRDHGRSAPDIWINIMGQMLGPDQPFEFHQMVYYGCYKSYPSPTPPAWVPNKESASLTNIGKLLDRKGKELLGARYKDPISSFDTLQEFSISNPEDYWKVIFEEMSIYFVVPPSRILCENTSNPGGKWLQGAFLNPAENCLRVNKKRNWDDVAVIWRDEGYDDFPLNMMTLKQLHAEVCLAANALDTLGLEKGSAIAIDMPMNVTAVIIYLAIILAGYVVVSIADSFAPPEISTRMKISNAKAIFTQDFVVRGNKKLPLYNKVVDSDAPLAIVVAYSGYNLELKLRDGDESWNGFLSSVKRDKEPKAIPWTNMTPLKAAADAWCHMDIRKGDIVAWPTNLGWMMGPWLVYASLLNGAAMALYNGSPLGTGFAKFVQDAKVTMLGVVPSIVRAWKNSNSTAGFDWSSIRCFASTGEASNVNEYLWLMGRAHYKPIIEYCGGTEIGGGFVTGSLLQPQALAAFSTPSMGCSLFILDENGNPLPQNATGIGELALYPIMFGASSKLLNASHYDVYFKGMPTWNGKMLRRHGDEFEYVGGGYYRAHGRADDTMNLGGIKVSSIEIERICNEADEAILETAAIGVPPSGGGPEQLVIAVVFKDKTLVQERLERLKSSFNSALQRKLNPLFKVASVMSVSSLPRTASNKVMRRVLRQHYSKVKLDAKI